MYPTKPSNTQVYSPLGSFVVEQHGRTERCDAIKQRYESDTYGWEKGIAVTWTLLLAGLLVGSIYNRLGRPEIGPTSPAEAAINGTLTTPSFSNSRSGNVRIQAEADIDR